ncbi:RNA polymerase sigma-70 factor (ECF subfamily) [Rhodopirellula rubra]|uniref:RNA polymerase sigma-70 factor (ECF subfamily) n=1 Tax=Aporhodopirellula rubra TaxID=980271 RepID=A0A7W5DVF3_9BACT|nr:sigma-70 family RNA polymerase sigma factor [Aporhodopirellula rubra]MBB3205248.1 RNA polymerase sigma-70 factor (ECF subfamily) [Aporhodopirellula rubra]
MNFDSATTEPQTRESLLVRLRNADDELAWAEFAAVYEPVIYRMVQRRGLQDADAREIVQEVLMSVAASIKRFDVSAKGSFRGWLSRITRNATIDRLRSVQSRREMVGGSSVARMMDAVVSNNGDGSGNRHDAELSHEFDRDHRQQLFRWAAGKVRSRTGEIGWIAFWKTAVEEQPIAEVASELGISEGAVYVARCRILKRIRELVHQRSND